MANICLFYLAIIEQIFMLLIKFMNNFLQTRTNSGHQDLDLFQKKIKFQIRQKNKKKIKNPGPGFKFFSKQLRMMENIRKKRFKNFPIENLKKIV